MLENLKKYGATSESQIHNTSWGFEGSHILFKNKLTENYPNTMHSDVLPSNLPNTYIYDITKRHTSDFDNYFDFIINVSTIEEVNCPHRVVIENLMRQVKVGGYMILTFDFDKYDTGNTFGRNTVYLPDIESYVNVRISEPNGPRLDGSNSMRVESYFSHLNVGVLILKKTGV